MNPNTLPAGIADRNFEAFSVNNTLKTFDNGQMVNLDTCADAMEYFENDMLNHPAAETAIMRNGITDRKQMVDVYVRCRFGGFDKQADITPDGITVPEYWDCGCRGKCKDEGVICKLPGGLTPGEIKVVKLVAADKANCEISGILNISINTVATHIHNIERKLQVAFKCGIVRFAIENNII